VGAALYEEFRYGADGSFLSGTFVDYLVPTACEIAEPQILHMETLSPFTPLGAKGLGEGNNMSTPVCIANAVADALADVADTRRIELPLTPPKILALIGLADPPPSHPAVQAPAPLSPAEAPGLSASGSIEIAATPEAVFRVLLDPAALAQVIPGCSKLTSAGEHRYRADVTLGIGLVKARFDAEIALSDLDPPHSLTLAGRGVGSLGAAEGRGSVKLARIATGTRLDYAYTSTVNGKLAAVGGRMLEGASRIVLQQLFARLGRLAASPTPAESPTPAASTTPAAPPTAARRSGWRRLCAWLGIAQ
ncbi:MAG TPA: SRPBCC domain-containing protein, partial [Casimicrobiaceae bacterium]